MSLSKHLNQAASAMKLLPGSTAAPFIIAGGPRTGSTLLQTLLNSHPNAICMHELLKESSDTPAFYRFYLGKRKSLLRLREKNISEFLNTLLLSPQPSFIKAIGFKALYSQPGNNTINWEEAWTALGQVPDLRVVWISRNEVRSVISFAIAKKSTKWIGHKTVSAVPVDVDYIARRLEWDHVRSQKARERLNHLPILDISYESLTQNGEYVIGEVLKHLSLPPAQLHSALRKQNPKPIRDLIENYDELEKRLSATRWYDKLHNEEHH